MGAIQGGKLQNISDDGTVTAVCGAGILRRTRVSTDRDDHTKRPCDISWRVGV